MIALHSELWRRRLSAYHDRLLAPREIAQVEAHLHTCVECQQRLQQYERLYRSLRAIPGFDGVIASPIAARARRPRPIFAPWAQGGAGQRAWGGIAAVILVIVMVMTVLSERASYLLGPSNNQGPLVNRSATPTLGIITADGEFCANVATTESRPYVYGGDNGLLFQVTDCATPSHFATLPFAEWRVVDWATGRSAFLVIGAASGPGALAVVDPRSGAVQAIPLRLTPGGATLKADEAIWNTPTSVMVRVRGDLYLADLTKGTLESLAPKRVAHLVARGSAIYYSALDGNHATIHLFDIATGNDATVFDLGYGDDLCATTGGGCYWTAAWDIAPDGQHIVVQAPLPTVLPAPNTTVPATLSYRLIAPAKTPAPEALFSFPLTLTPTLVQFSPDGTRVAAQVVGGKDLTIAALISMTTTTIPANATFSWRGDGLGIITQPNSPRRGGADPRIYLILTGRSYPLSSGTANYVWFP